MSKISVEIFNEDACLFQGETTFLVAPGEEGELGILPNHAPLLSSLKEGEIRIQTNGEDKTFAIKKGFIELRSNKIQIFL